MGAKITPGPWVLATSNSWRRFVARDGGNVCEPITQNDGHPDLHFSNGGADGPDARLIAAAPELLAALKRAESQLSFRYTANLNRKLMETGLHCDQSLGDDLTAVRAAIAKATA